MGADSEKELKIKITTSASTGGISETQSEFQKLEERLRGSGQSVREFRDLMYQIDRLAPGVGDLLEAAFTGPVPAIIGLTTAAGYGVKYLKEMEASLDNIIESDPTALIDKADALAKKFNGIADAVARANVEFNSPQGIFERGQKAIDAQNLSPAAKAQAELANILTEAANAQIQADLARQKLAGFHLPEDDNVAKAQMETLKKEADERQKNADALKKEAALRADQVATMQANGPFTGTALAAGAHPVLSAESFFGAGGSYAAAILFPALLRAAASSTAAGAASEQANAIGSDRAAAEKEDLIKQRDAAKKDAEQKAAEAEKLRLEADFEKDPSNIGSKAWHISRQKQFDTGEGAFQAQIKSASDELNSLTSGGKGNLQQLLNTLAKAVALMRELHAAGDANKNLDAEIDDLRAQIKTVSLNASQ